MTKREDLKMQIENKMLGIGLTLKRTRVSLFDGAELMSFGPIEKRREDEILGDAKLELESIPEASAFIADVNGIGSCVKVIVKVDDEITAKAVAESSKREADKEGGGAK